MEMYGICLYIVCNKLLLCPKNLYLYLKKDILAGENVKCAANMKVLHAYMDSIFRSLILNA